MIGVSLILYTFFNFRTNLEAFHVQVEFRVTFLCLLQCCDHALAVPDVVGVHLQERPFSYKHICHLWLLVPVEVQKTRVADYG